MRIALIAVLGLSACVFNPVDTVAACEDDEDPLTNGCVVLFFDGAGTGGDGDSINPPGDSPDPNGDPVGADVEGDALLAPGDAFIDPCLPDEVFFNGTCEPTCGPDEDLSCVNGICAVVNLNPRCVCDRGWGGPLCAACNDRFYDDGAGNCLEDCGLNPAVCLLGGGTCAPSEQGNVCACDGWAGCGIEAECGINFDLSGERCDCASGYQDNDNDSVCEPACIALPPELCPGLNEACDDTSGTPQCLCDFGFSRNGTSDCVPDCDSGCTATSACNDNTNLCECDSDFYQFDPATPECEPTCAAIGECGGSDTCVEEPGVGAVCKCVIFVDANANGDDDGTSWEHAYSSFATAVNEFEPQSLVGGCELWLTPDQYSVGELGAPIQLHGSSAIVGGFTGNRTVPWERDMSTVKTSLSGQNFAAPVSYIAPVIHVVGPDSLIDGVSIVDGRADTTTTLFDSGGGVRADTVAQGLVIRDVLFQDNRAIGYGGGLFASALGDLELRRVGFTGNEANAGAAIYLEGGTTRIADTVITDSLAGIGALALASGAVDLFGVAFVSNLAGPGAAAAMSIGPNSFVYGERVALIDNAGPSVVIGEAAAVFHRSFFASNGNGTAPYGVMQVGQFSSVSIHGTTFTDNRASSGSWSVMSLDPQASAAIDSSIVAGNGPLPIAAGPGLTLSYSYIDVSCASCTDGGNNLDVNRPPLYQQNADTPSLAWSNTSHTGFPLPVTVISVTGVGFVPPGSLAVVTEGGRSFYLPITSTGADSVTVPGHWPDGVGDGAIVIKDLTPRANSPTVDAAKFTTGMELDPFGRLIHDQAGVLNVGTGVYDYADIGAFELTP